MKTIEGLDAKTPKQSVKAFYLAKYLKEDEYMQLLKAIDDRNELSHVYKEELFKEIVGRFPTYLVMFQSIISQIEKKSQDTQ